MTQPAAAKVSAPFEEVVRRGIDPQLLQSQVLNTAAYIFSEDFPTGESFSYVDVLRTPRPDFILEDYFGYCIAAHFATVASFVPTDVDQTIRLKLWRIGSPEERLNMAEKTLQFLQWNDRPVSKKRVEVAAENILTGHHGEWFSIAFPAYWYNLHPNREVALKIYERMIALVEQHERLFKKLLEWGDLRSLLEASVIVAHNLGDLDRVIDMSEVALDHPVRKELYKIGQIKSTRYPSLFAAGELNRKMTATENHRNFALRKPRCLRLSADLLLPIGPFFDSWGARLARYPAFSESDLAEVVEALIEGWEKLNQKQETVGYARALAGIFSCVRGGPEKFLKQLPASKRKLVMAGNLRNMLSISQERFEESWRRRADKLLSGI